MRVIELVGGPADGTVIVQGEDGAWVVIQAAVPVEWDGAREQLQWAQR